MALWVVFALLSAFFSSAKSIVNKKVLEHEHALEYGAAQGFVSLLFVIFLLPFISFDIDLRIIAFIYVISVAYTAGNLYYLRSIRHSPLTRVDPLMNFSSVFLLIIAFVFLGEQPGLQALLGVLLLIVGTYVLEMGSGKKGFFEPFKVLVRSKYSLFMIMAMLIYSLTSIMEKAVFLRGVDAVTLLVFMYLFVSINYLVIELVKHGSKEVIQNVRRDGKLLVWGSICGLAAVFFVYSAMAVPGALVGLIIPIKRVSTLITTLWGGRLFHEHRLGWKLFASTIMLIGILLIAL